RSLDRCGLVYRAGAVQRRLFVPPVLLPGLFLGCRLAISRRLVGNLANTDNVGIAMRSSTCLVHRILLTRRSLLHVMPRVVAARAPYIEVRPYHYEDNDDQKKPFHNSHRSQDWLS